MFASHASLPGSSDIPLTLGRKMIFWRGKIVVEPQEFFLTPPGRSRREGAGNYRNATFPVKLESVPRVIPRNYGNPGPWQCGLLYRCHSSCGLDVGSWVSTDMHLDNWEIQKIGTNFNVLCGQSTACKTCRRRILVLFQTKEAWNLKSGTTTSNPLAEWNSWSEALYIYTEV